MAIAILGIGQSLRGDDGAGLAAVQLWSETHPATAEATRVELVESPGVGLLNLLEGVDTAILVDAVQSGAPPGTLHNLTEESLAAFLAGSDSAHGWGVAETLALGRKVAPNEMPSEVILIGIEVENITLGEEISPQIEAVLPEVAQLIEEIIQQLRG
jgi:hydrogenase maturation protease